MCRGTNSSFQSGKMNHVGIGKEAGNTHGHLMPESADKGKCAVTDNHWRIRGKWRGQMCEPEDCRSLKHRGVAPPEEGESRV